MTEDGMIAMPPGDALGRVEFIVESRRRGALETWLVVRADRACLPRYAELGLDVVPGSRVVVEAGSMRPVGVLDPELPEPTSPAGYNPYFDLPAA